MQSVGRVSLVHEHVLCWEALYNTLLPSLGFTTPSGLPRAHHHNHPSSTKIVFDNSELRRQYFPFLYNYLVVYFHSLWLTAGWSLTINLNICVITLV